MELINHSGFPALMFRNVTPGDDLLTSIIVRVTYNIMDGKAVISPQQEYGLNIAPWESEFGPMESDNIFRLGGVDILVFGKARPLNNKPVNKMQVSVKIKNKLSCSLLVFGDRYWKKNIMGLSITDPEPFVEMPLTLYNSYGGKAEWDGLKIPYGNNPYGKGYYWEKDDAINNPLPNIEDPGSLITEWNSHPDPVGISCCPMGELRMRNNVEYKDNLIKSIGARFFNTAFPKMIIDEITAGERIIIEGMSTNGTFSFEIPDHKLNLNIKIGEKINDRILKIDQVGIFPDKQQAFITYRFPFRYKFEPLQIRKCEITEFKIIT